MTGLCESVSNQHTLSNNIEINQLSVDERVNELLGNTPTHTRAHTDKDKQQACGYKTAAVSVYNNHVTVAHMLFAVGRSQLSSICKMTFDVLFIFLLV